jgi:uncharacterized protein (TIGR03083 family)
VTVQATVVRPLGAVYEATLARIVRLVRDSGRGAAEAAAVPVPACPSWSVRDVIAHVTGLYADIMAGNLQGAGSEEWTAAQVERRRNVPIDELLAEADDVGPNLAAMVDDFPGQYGNQVVADLAVHEHDIRGALGQPGARQSLAGAVGTEFLLEAIVRPGARALGLAPLEVRAGDRSWVAGTREPPTGDPEAAIAAAISSGEREPTSGLPPVGRVTAEPFELFRALTGRRSAAQIHCFDWTVDPDPFLALFDLWPFTLRTTDLAE